MSNTERDPQPGAGGGLTGVAPTPVHELLPGTEVPLGGPRAMTVTRTLPTRGRRMVGAWCFLDHFGPTDVVTGPGMRVPPHPHTGLQTVSWLVGGEVLHRDSLGSEQLIRPGQLNLMTAGQGIAHSEESPHGSTTPLHGVQLWVALPEANRATAPAFDHHADLPVLTDTGVTVTLMIGELAGATSPARAYSPMLGAEIALEPGQDAHLPLEPEFEHAVLIMAGDVDVDGAKLAPGPLLYLGCGRSGVSMRAERPSRVLLLGGAPFEEHIVMWWNFVGRSHDEIVEFRADWEAGRGFGTVPGYPGEPLAAPPMPGTPLKARGRVR